VRQLSPSTNLVLAVLAGLGLLGSLGLPWFASPILDPVRTDGPIEKGAFQVGRFFAAGAPGTVNGSDAAGGLLAVVVGVVALMTILVLAVGTPSIRRHAEEYLRILVFVAPVVVIATAIVHTGTNVPVHVHYGLLVSLVATGLMCSAAWHGANMREKKAAPVRPRYGTSGR
jgi:hypothetical protein